MPEKGCEIGLRCRALRMIPMQTRENPLSHFEADREIQEIAEAYSLDMIDFASQKFGIVLDWSDESMRHVEQIAVALHEIYKKTRPTPDQIAPFYRMLGRSEERRVGKQA